MSERRERRWSWWMAKSAVAMATLAALSLAVCVWFAQHALDQAADVVVRGDGDGLVGGIVVDLWEAEWPLTSEALGPVLAKHREQQVRYIALADRKDHKVFAEAGAPAIAVPFDLPGEIVRHGRLARLVALIPPPWETRSARAASALGPGAAAAASQPVLNPRPYLVVEFESPVIARLQKDLTRIWAVAAVAALVLIAFAFAWSRTTARLSAVQRRAESERRLVALGQASSVIAHELRNPLAALKGHAQLLLEDLAGPSRAKAARVVEGAERLERLTSVLLDFVRDGPLDFRTVTPAELVDRAIAQLPKDRVQVDLSRAPDRLQVDPERASLALRNILQNAIQATTDEAQPVEVRFHGDAHEVVIEVRDHGAGLALGEEGHIFEPFVTTKTRGTGLGLSIARRIAEQHRGTLTGETHTEGGALFRLVLPLVSRHPGSS
jgi:two-component system sensor histidine kinase HydH